MMLRTVKLPFFAGLILCLAVFTATQARAAVKIQAPNAEPVSPSDTIEGQLAAASASASTDSSCCPTVDRCIRYRHHRTLRRTCCGCGTMKLVLQVKDCCRCCCVNVPVCVPCGCTDAPSVCTTRGLFGRQAVTYTWCCGYKVRVEFDRCGDVIVHSYGR